MTVKEEPRFIPKRTPCKMVAHALIPAFRRLKEETRDFKVVENLRASAGLKNKTKQNTKRQNKQTNKQTTTTNQTRTIVAKPQVTSQTSTSKTTLTFSLQRDFYGKLSTFLWNIML